MRRADRLFDILLILRTARRPITAARLAEQLEVAPRTIYRDVATLQARRIPIEGEAGVGYVLRRGFDLPPLMFTVDEIEAVAVGARLVRRLHDRELQSAARRVLDKVAVILPERLRDHVERPFYVSPGDAAEPRGVTLGDIRLAIRDRRKMRIAYDDEQGRRTRRTIWPLAMAYYVDATLVGAWCELRRDLRNFRVERIAQSNLLAERFHDPQGGLLDQWLALPKERSGRSKAETTGARPRSRSRRAAARRA